MPEALGSSLVNIHSPTWSVGANWSSAVSAAPLASSSLVWPADPTSSPIEPDTSSSSSTRAGLRSSVQAERSWSNTAGAGGLRVIETPSASTSELSVIGVPGVPSYVRNPASVNAFCPASERTNSSRSDGPGLAHRVGPGSVEGHPGAVGEQRALLGVDRHQRDLGRGVVAQRLRVARGVAGVVVQDRLLLHRDRADVAEAAPRSRRRAAGWPGRSAWCRRSAAPSARPRRRSGVPSGSRRRPRSGPRTCRWRPRTRRRSRPGRRWRCSGWSCRG